MKLFFAAPLSGLPSDPTALGAAGFVLAFEEKRFAQFEVSRKGEVASSLIGCSRLPTR
jgi:hypothetical protein